MSRKKQNIEVVLHMPKDLKKIYEEPQVREFWEEKIITKIRSYNLSKEECFQLIEKIEKQ